MATISKSLYRSVRQDDFPDGLFQDDDEPVDGILHGDIDPRSIIVQGRSTTRQDWHKDRSGYFKTGHGTSLWDKRGVFGHRHWIYFTLPEGTVVPDSLKLVEGNWSDRYQATHWQIEVANGGSLRADALRGALDNLTRNCIVRAVELGISNT